MFRKLVQRLFGDPSICCDDPELKDQAGWEICFGDRRTFLKTLLRAAPEGAVLHIETLADQEGLFVPLEPWLKASRGGRLSSTIYHVAVNQASLSALEDLIDRVQIEKEWWWVKLFKGRDLLLEAPDCMDECTFVCGHSFDAEIEALRKAGAIGASWFEPEAP